MVIGLSGSFLEAATEFGLSSHIYTESKKKKSWLAQSCQKNTGYKQ